MYEPLLKDSLAPVVTQREVPEAQPEPEKCREPKMAKLESLPKEKAVPSSELSFLVQVTPRNVHHCP